MIENSKLEEYNRKIVILESKVKDYLLNKIRSFYKGELDLNKFDINTLFMISSYNFSKEQMNDVLHYLLNVIQDIQNGEIVWEYMDDEEARFDYQDDGKVNLLTTKENYNNYEVLNLVYNKLDSMKLEKKLIKN